MSKPSDSPSEFLPTRSSLLQRLKTWANEADWKEFFDTYQRSIRGLALKCGLNHAEAEEVVQETMVAVAKQMPGFEYDRSVGSFKGWLFTITRRAVGKQLARRSPPPAGPSEVPGTAAELEQIPDPAPGFEERWEEDWKKSLLEMAIERVRRRVSPKQFQMFDLYVSQQLPMEQVTRVLNVSAARVYMAKLRVSAAIRHELVQLQQKLI